MLTMGEDGLSSQEVTQGKDQTSHQKFSSDEARFVVWADYPASIVQGVPILEEAGLQNQLGDHIDETIRSRILE